MGEGRLTADDDRPSTVRRPWTWAVAGVLLLALALRLWGIGFGLPYEYHVDEPQYVRQGAAMGREGLRPTWWNNPPLFKYLLFGECVALYAGGRLAGWYDSTADFAAQSFSDPTRLYLLGRATSALFGTLTVLVVFWLGRAAANARVGLIAAGFLAVCFLHVRESHFAVNDAAVLFFISVALLAAVRIVDTGAVRWYALGGAALGLGFATKYSAALSLLPLLLAHAFSPGVCFRRPLRLEVRRLCLALGCMAGAAVVASPYFLLAPGDVIRDAYESLYLPGKRGFDGWQLDPAGGYLFYLKTLAWGLGWGLLGLSAAGLAWAAVRRRPKGWVLLCQALATYLALGGQRMYFARFALPMVPALLVLGASALDAVACRRRDDGRGTRDDGPSSAVPGRRSMVHRLAPCLVALVAAGVCVQPAAASARLDALLARTDTRTLAREWLEGLPEGSRIAADWLSHPGSYGLPGMVTFEGVGLAANSIDWYREQGFDYVVTSSFLSQIPLADPQANAAREAFYARLDERFGRAWEIRATEGDSEPRFAFDEIYGPWVSLWQRERPGPTVRVYRVDDGR